MKTRKGNGEGSCRKSAPGKYEENKDDLLYPVFRKTYRARSNSAKRVANKKG